MKTILLGLICFALLFGCKKNNDSDNPPATNRVDTLTAGWTKLTRGFSDIFFTTNLVGYGLDSVGINKTIDGGNSWSALTSDATNLFNINCSPDGKAFFSGFNSYIIQTNDGGVSFDTSNFGSRISDVYFPDNNNGFAVGSSGFYQTVDGGSGWQVVTPLTGLVFTNNANIYSTLFFTDASTGWVVAGTNIFHTNGSINNWQAGHFNQVPGAELDCIYVPNPNTVYTCSANGEVYKSSDGGANFSLMIDFPETGFSDIHFVDSNTGYVSIDKKIYKTSDGGVNWQNIVTLASEYFSELHFTDANHGWACALENGGPGALLIYNH